VTFLGNTYLVPNDKNNISAGHQILTTLADNNNAQTLTFRVIRLILRSVAIENIKFQLQGEN